MNLKLSLLFTMCCTTALCQHDSLRVLSLTDILQLARENHPIIKQANLQKDFAEAELRYARGQFDPKLTSGYSEKQFRNTEYYQKFGSALKIPVWFPLDPKVEVARNEGEYLNPENYISSTRDYWQVSAGVSVPLGKGLFIDERRTMVKQARIYGDLAEAERIKLVNKTLLTIIKSYWDWYFAYREYELMVQSIEIAENLFERVKFDFEFGEAAVVDTVQAKITYQNRKIDLRKATLDLTQARLKFSIHLWGPDNIPLELADDAIPHNEDQFGVIPPDSSLHVLSDWASKNHPEILKMEAKKNQLEVERRWNRESLKPEINLSYSLIDAPVSYEGFESPQWLENYKLGVEFYFPLFLRKERGKLQKTKLYIESIEYDLIQVKQEIITSVEGGFAALKTNEALVREYEAMAANYRRLLDAELFNMEMGESDLFKLNIQQDKYLESQMKYLDALTKLEKLKASLPYAIGLPNLSYRSLYE